MKSGTKAYTFGLNGSLVDTEALKVQTLVKFAAFHPWRRSTWNIAWKSGKRGGYRSRKVQYFVEIAVFRCFVVSGETVCTDQAKI